MALFSKKTETKKKAAPKAAKPAKVVAPASRADVIAKDTKGRLQGVLKAPWFTEKALIGTENGVYVFAVPADATKQDVAAAVEAIYKVTPVKVNMANLPGKRKALRSGRGQGTRARRHKAYVYLKKGDTLQFA